MQKNKDNLVVGDFVRYTVKNELGLVGEVLERGARCWYHTGGTRALSPCDIIEKISPLDAIFDDFSNNYARASLIERRERLLRGEDVSDLIDDKDISEQVHDILNL